MLAGRCCQFRGHAASCIASTTETLPSTLLPLLLDVHMPKSLSFDLGAGIHAATRVVVSIVSLALLWSSLIMVSPYLRTLSSLQTNGSQCFLFLWPLRYDGKKGDNSEFLLASSGSSVTAIQVLLPGGVSWMEVAGTACGEALVQDRKCLQGGHEGGRGTGQDSAVKVNKEKMEQRIFFVY